MNERFKRDTLTAIVRIADLAKEVAQNQANQKVFTGVMFSLTILYEEFTGRRLATHPVRPKDVMEWANRIRETGELPDVRVN